MSASQPFKRGPTSGHQQLRAFICGVHTSVITRSSVHSDLSCPQCHPNYQLHTYPLVQISCFCVIPGDHTSTALTAQTAIMGLSVSLCYSSRYNDTLSSSKFHILSLVIAARVHCKKNKKLFHSRARAIDCLVTTPYHHPITLPNNIIQSIYTA